MTRVLSICRFLIFGALEWLSSDICCSFFFQRLAYVYGYVKHVNDGFLKFHDVSLPIVIDTVILIA